MGPRLGAGEDVLELHHAGVGEQERRIVVRDERRGGHDLMTVGPEILEEMGANFVTALHGFHLARGGRRCKETAS